MVDFAVPATDGGVGVEEEEEGVKIHVKGGREW